MLIRTALSAISPAGHNAKLSILIFHRVLPEADPLFPDEPCVQRFEQLMVWLREWFNILPLEEAVERLQKGDLPARSAAITFDDGYADNATHALPILKKHHLPATFFITTGFLNAKLMWNDVVIESIRNARVDELDASFVGLGERRIDGADNKREVLQRLIPAIKHRLPKERDDLVAIILERCNPRSMPSLMMNDRQILELRDAGMTIGAHTKTHPILANLDPIAAISEIDESRLYLASLLKQKIELFAYPNGKIDQDYNAGTCEIVKSLGFSAAVSTNWGYSTSQTDLFQLPRFSPWDRSKHYFALRMMGNLLGRS